MEFENVYFLGIGGIGMSALARYFLHEGQARGGLRPHAHRADRCVGGRRGRGLLRRGCGCASPPFRDRRTTVVVYTPAVPDDHAGLAWFRH